MFNSFSRHWTVPVQKVKAHVVESADLSDRDRFFKVGNDAADEAAKAGLAAHPQATDEQQFDLAKKIRVAKAVCLLAARLLPLWPRLDLSGVELAKAPGKNAAKKVGTELHEWEWCRSYWRCSVCLKIRRPLDF